MSGEATSDGNVEGGATEAFEMSAEIHLGIGSDAVKLPYPPRRHPDGGVTHPQRSILEEPGALEEIPELVGEPHLKRFVAAIHVPEGQFETFRIERRVDPLGDGVWRQFMALGIMFRSRELFREYWPCVALAGNLLRWLDREDVRSSGPFRLPKGGDMGTGPAVAILATLQEAYLSKESLPGWVFDLHVLGPSSPTPEGARAEMSRILDVLAPFFVTGQPFPEAMVDR